MKLLIILTVGALIPIIISLPSILNTVDSERKRNPVLRSNIDEQHNNGRNDYSIKVPAFIESIYHSIKKFFIGPSGVITKLRNFVNGKIKVSIRFFGRKVDLQANIPLSLEEVDKALRSFLEKLRTDPMTRVLFTMYLNVVVIIVVFLSLIAKHVQISLQSLQRSSRMKMNNSPTPLSTHVRNISPDLSMPRGTVTCRRQSSELHGNAIEESNIQANNDDISLSWSAIVNPSLFSSVNLNTFSPLHEAPLLLSDLREMFSFDQNDDIDCVTQISRIPTCSEAGPIEDLQNKAKQNQLLSKRN